MQRGQRRGQRALWRRAPRGGRGAATGCRDAERVAHGRHAWLEHRQEGVEAAPGVAIRFSPATRSPCFWRAPRSPPALNGGSMYAKSNRPSPVRSALPDNRRGVARRAQCSNVSASRATFASPALRRSPDRTELLGDLAPFLGAQRVHRSVRRQPLPARTAAAAARDGFVRRARDAQVHVVVVRVSCRSAGASRFRRAKSALRARRARARGRSAGPRLRGTRT